MRFALFHCKNIYWLSGYIVKKKKKVVMLLFLHYENYGFQNGCTVFFLSIKEAFKIYLELILFGNRLKTRTELILSRTGRSRPVRFGSRVTPDPMLSTILLANNLYEC